MAYKDSFLPKNLLPVEKFCIIGMPVVGARFNAIAGFLIEVEERMHKLPIVDQAGRNPDYITIPLDQGILNLFRKKLTGIIPQEIDQSKQINSGLHLNQSVEVIHEVLSTPNPCFFNPTADLIAHAQIEVPFRGLRGTINDSLLELPHLNYLDLSGDDFLGNPFPNFIVDLTRLRYLNLSSNGLSEHKHLDVGFNSLEGVISEAHFLNLSKLQHLDLSDISGARISDTIRGWFWNLSPKLSSLNLSNKQMSGMFPNYSSEYLLYIGIDFSSSQFEGPLPGFPSNTTSLNLSNNQFIGSLSWFEALTLHSSSLYGKLPPSLNHCNMLIFLDPSVNGLSGEIPAWIGESLSSLIFLSLYSNEFSGIIQLHPCQLAKIQIFDLSVNNISGTIPKFLSNFTSMVKEGDCAEFVKKQFGWSNARKDWSVELVPIPGQIMELAQRE
uniref:Uncharacterized protein n=1 Tax=Salix viminalis TaxID=40686 RepID=A0A6N2LME7_SALVM